MKKTFYITTTLPYVNADPHIGFAMEIIRADVIARAKALQGYEVFFNTGTDEHGQKLLEAAKKADKSVESYVDEYAEKFRELKGVLGLSDDIHFIRTTDSNHVASAQEFWKRVTDNGYIYKKNYTIKYCVGCEEEKTESQLENGHCPLHPDRELEIIEEENYFFKLSEFGDRLLKLYENKPDFIIPTSRLHEMQEFVKRGLEDISISRLSSKMSWGVPVPRDSDHVMYVWFDALVSYISTLGWPENTEQFEKFWVQGTPVQYCGKDNTRFQSVLWQAMLLAADLPNTNRIVVNGFINSDGQKMSKSIGNVVNPYDLVKEYGTDAVRYYVTRELAPFEDSDFTIEKFKEAYNANLANGLGNLTSRIMKMATDNLDGPVEISEVLISPYPEYSDFLNQFEIQKASDLVWRDISALDLIIQTEMPFKLIKTDTTKGKKIISDLVVALHRIAQMLEPILSETSLKIKTAILENKMPETLFPRKD